MIADRRDLIEMCETLAKAGLALANKADATGECDHKRQSCEDVGCIGAEVKAFRAALAKWEAK